MLRSAFFLVALASSAVAQGSADLCRISSQIAGSAVEERVGGASETAAIVAITAGLGGETAGYAAAVEPIVSWVYTLPEDQLTGDVANLYEEACLAQ